MQMVNNQFVEGVVYTKIDSVLAVPETAVVYAENNAYLLMYEKEEDTSFFFQKVKVTTGRIANNYIEITDQLPKGNLLVKGIYNIQIESLQ